MRLTVKSNGEVIMDLEHSDGVVIIRKVKDNLRPALYRWIEHGIHYHAEGEDVYYVSAKVSDFAFLEKLHEYLKMQFNFDFCLQP